MHCFFILVGVLLASGHLATPSGAGQFVICLLLLQAWVPASSWTYAYNGPSWSLSCEAFFYAMFPVIGHAAKRFSPWHLAILAGGWLIVGAGAVVWFFPERQWDWLLYINPLYRIGEFALGIALARLVRSGLRPFSRIWALGLMGTGYLTSVGLSALGVYVHVFVTDLLMLPGFAFVIVSYAQLDLSGRSTAVTRSTIAGRLGEASFALYLVHQLLMRFADSVFVLSKQSAIGFAFFALGIVVVSTVVSLFVHRLLERPMEKKLRDLISPPVALNESVR